MGTGACSRASPGPGRGSGRGTAGCWNAANARRASAALCARRGRCRSRRRAVPSTSRADPTVAHVTDDRARPRAFGFPSLLGSRHGERAPRKHLQTCSLKVFDLFIEPEKQRHETQIQERPRGTTVTRALILFPLLPEEKKRKTLGEDLQVKGSVYRSARPSVALSSSSCCCSCSGPPRRKADTRSPVRATEKRPHHQTDIMRRRSSARGLSSTPGREGGRGPGVEREGGHTDYT